jgi:hypothetical protein
MHPHGAEGIKPHSPARSRSLEAADAPPSRVPRRTSFLRGGRRHARGGCRPAYPLRIVWLPHSLAPSSSQQAGLLEPEPWVAGAQRPRSNNTAECWNVARGIELSQWPRQPWKAAQ